MRFGRLMCFWQSLRPLFLCRCGDRKFARRPPKPIASVVMAYSKKGKRRTRLLKNLWRTVRFYDMNRRVLLSQICSLSGICTADNSSQILKERIWLSTFRLQTIATEIENIAVWQNKKRIGIGLKWVCSLPGRNRFSSVWQEKKLNEMTSVLSEFVR